MILWSDREEELLDQIVFGWRSGNYDAIKVSCYNKEEAEEIKTRARLVVPDIVLYTSWMDFDYRKEK